MRFMIRKFFYNLKILNILKLLVMIRVDNVTI